MRLLFPVDEAVSYDCPLIKSVSAQGISVTKHNDKTVMKQNTCNYGEFWFFVRSYRYKYCVAFVSWLDRGRVFDQPNLPLKTKNRCKYCK